MTAPISRASYLLCLFSSCLFVAPIASQEAAPPPPKAAVVPASDSKPLPDLGSLIARAKANADAMMDLRQSYTCRMVSVQDQFDSHGSKKGTDTDEYQVFYVDKHELHQHLAHNGKPLTGDDQKKEQARIDQRVADIKNHKDKSNGGIVLRASSLLKVATISNPRRETINGRPTILFDYKGNPDAKADGLPEEIMKKLEGSIAIDEQDAALVRLNGSLQENFHVAGGLLVNVKKGSHFDIVNRRVNDEVWFTSTFVAHADGRILLFKGFDGDSHVTFSDYRKMKTSVTLLPGSQVIGEDGKPIPNLEAEPDTTPAAPTPKP